jgi:hypothetical protein
MAVYSWLDFTQGQILHFLVIVGWLVFGIAGLYYVALPTVELNLANSTVSNLVTAQLSLLVPILGPLPIDQRNKVIDAIISELDTLITEADRKAEIVKLQREENSFGLNTLELLIIISGVLLFVLFLVAVYRYSKVRPGKKRATLWRSFLEAFIISAILALVEWVFLTSVSGSYIYIGQKHPQLWITSLFDQYVSCDRDDTANESRCSQSCTGTFEQCPGGGFSCSGRFQYCNSSVGCFKECPAVP